MPELRKTEALALHSTPWRDSSKIVQLFTRDFGYQKVIVKGALRPKSPFRGQLETLNLVETVIAHKESRGLQLLTEAYLLNPFLKLKEDLNKMAVGFAMAELIRKLLAVHESTPRFFDDTARLLETLNNSVEAHLLPFLWYFLFRISEALGVGWTFNRCIRCEKPMAEATHAGLDIRGGGLVCGNCQRSELNQINLTKQEISLLNTLCYDSIPNVAGRISELAALERLNLTRLGLGHLNYHTESRLELKSLNWYRV